MDRTSDEWIDQYKKKDALWIHDGNPKRPHARLTSGKHSNGFFNSRLVIPDEVLLREAACDLLELFVQEGGDISKVNGVVGPQTGATKLAELLAMKLASITGYSFFASPAKNEKGGEKSMIFNEDEIHLLLGQSVLLCEDVLTTGRSVDLTATAVGNAEGVVLSFILTLVNRSGLTDTNGKKIIALINRPMPIWMPDECPLCREGSEAIYAKGPPEWARLNAEY